MDIKSEYCCPECEKTIFNRRISICEFCGSELPEGLLIDDPTIYTKEQLDLLRARLKNDRQNKPLSNNRNVKQRVDIEENRTEMIESIMNDIDYI